MNTTLFFAGCLAAMVGIVHSVLGERLVFSRMRAGEIVPAHGEPLLLERHVRILWASRHIVTIFGLAFAAMLIGQALQISPDEQESVVKIIISVATSSSGILVLVATKARHPGWIGLLGVSLLVCLS